jgi:PAS domain S-box-containing protein
MNESDQLGLAVALEEAKKRIAELERDLTAQYDANAALNASQENYRWLVEASYTAIAVVSRDGRILYVNPAGARLWNDPHLIGKTIYQIFPAEYAERYQQAIYGVIDSQTDLLDDSETIVNGKPMYFQLSMTPLRNLDGTVDSLTLQAWDITERRIAEKALQIVEERFHLIADTIDEVFWMSGTQPGDLLYVSPGFARLWGIPIEKIHANPQLFHDAIAPEDRSRVKKMLSLKQQGVGYSMEYSILRPDGTTRVVFDCAYPVRDKSRVVTRYVGVAQDITERKKIEIALRTNEEMYRGLMESLDSAVCLVDGAGVFLYLNDVAAQKLGAGNAAALVGKTIHQLFPEPVASQQWQLIRQVLAIHEPLMTEMLTVIHGQSRWYRIALQPLRDDAGEVTQVLLNLTDIHSLKTIEQELLDLNRTLEERVRERAQEVQDLYDHAPAGYHSVDANGCYVMVNETELNWLGYSREEMLSRPFSDFIVPESLPVFQQNFPLFKQRGWIKDLEFIFRRKDGSTFPALMSATAVRSATGEFLFSRSTVVDISALKAAERAVRASEETYRALFDNATDAIFLVDASTLQIVRVNPPCVALLGYSPQEMLGHRPDEYILPDEQEDAHARREQLLRQHALPPYERIFVRKDGSHLDAEVTLTLVNDVEGKPVVFQSLVRDITRRKQAEEALQLANMEMERALRMKDEFLANMSHELRTPLNAILGISESFLLNPASNLTEKQLRHIGIINESGAHLLRLINDILDISKVGAGKLELELGKVSVHTVCDASLRMVKELAHKKQLTLELDITPICTPFGPMNAA